MTTSYSTLIFVCIFLASVSSTSALHCYCGSNVTKIATCEAARDTDVCMTYRKTCSKGVFWEDCKDLNPPYPVEIFYYTYSEGCNDPNIIYYWDPQCCSTDYCNAPPGTPISTHTPTRSKAPTTKSLNTDTNIIYVISAAVVLSLSGVIYLLVRRFRNTSNSKINVKPPDESRGLLSVSIEPAEDEVIGYGSYTVVKRVVKDGKICALKKQLLNDKEVPIDLSEEYEIMQRLHHRNILTAHDYDSSSLYLELCDCSLATRIPSLTDGEVLSYIKQLASALLYLQFECFMNEAVIHCDINPRNILLVKEDFMNEVMLLKVADFGLAKVVSKQGILPSFSIDHSKPHIAKVTDVWTSPDVNLRRTHSFVTDLYSFAIVCGQMVLRNMVQDLESLNEQLAERKTKSKTYDAQIATFCLDIIDYKNQMAVKSGKKKLASKRPENANEVKVKLEEVLRAITLQEKMKIESPTSDSKFTPDVIEL